VFERFTEGARRVVIHAQEEARLLQHSAIAPEHMLLGLLRTDAREGRPRRRLRRQTPEAPDLVAVTALQRSGVELEAARSVVRELVGEGAEPPPSHVPFTSPAKGVLERSLSESQRTGDRHIGSGHILLALLVEEDGVAMDVLQRLADPSQVHEEVTSLLATRRFDAEAASLGAGPMVLGPRCPDCHSSLGESARWSSVLATDPQSGRARSFAVVYCTACGTTVGVLPEHGPPDAPEDR
jgi:ATP-dependent Clp protease ATP-binding subunit ClpC